MPSRHRRAITVSVEVVSSNGVSRWKFPLLMPLPHPGRLRTADHVREAEFPARENGFENLQQRRVAD
jgi:hypothetical protein